MTDSPGSDARWSLAGIVVVDLATTPSGAFAARLLADYGATVVRVEPPAGDPLRGEGPFMGGTPHPERSIPFLALNAGKQSACLDLEHDDGRAALDQLLRRAAAIILSGPPRDVTAMGLDAREIGDRYPHLVVTRLTPLGMDGPRAGWHSEAIVQHALGGWTHVTGSPDRAPLTPWWWLADLLPGLGGAAATLMALHARELDGRGQVVDLTQLEILALMMHYVSVGFSYSGIARNRSGMLFPYTTVRAADGYLGVNVLTGEHWRALCEFTGLTHLLHDPRLATRDQRAVNDAEIHLLLARWAARLPATRTFHAGQAAGVPLGLVPPLAAVVALDQHTARSFFETVDHPDAGPLRYPGLPVRMRGRAPVRRAPRLGEHGELPAPPERPVERQPVPYAAAGRRGPLRDIAIVDLSMWWAGPLVTEMFALFGADVVKVESIQRLDGWRYPVAGTYVHEESPTFNGINLNKRGITLDLSREEGRALLRPLVEEADALVENYSAGVMAKFGLTPEVLLGWNPRLVIFSMTGFGGSGPWRDYVGFAPNLEQLSGLPNLDGYEDGPPVILGLPVADPAAGMAATVALLAALRERDRSGRGQQVDFSLLEAMTGLLTPALLEQQATGKEPQRWGNAHPRFAPHGCYSCAHDGDWLALAITDDPGFAALARFIGQPKLVADQRFATAAGRVEHREVLDTLIADWARGRNAAGIAAALQETGVAAARVSSPGDLHDDPQLWHLGFYTRLDRPFVGTHAYPGLPFRFSRTPGEVRTPAPTLGQHNEEVLGEGLRLDRARLHDLEATGIIGWEPIANR